MKSKLAWIVSAGECDADDECACVVFAPDDESSIQIGFRALGLEDQEGCSTSRAPEFDAWAAQGEVPPKVLLEHGWFIGCHGCGSCIHQGDGDATEKVIEHGSFLFCSKECQVEQIAEVMKVNAAFEEFQEEVKARWPGLTFTGFEGGWPILTPFGRFTFPGSLYGGGRVRKTRDGKLELAVAAGDMKAWELWSSQVDKSSEVGG